MRLLQAHDADGDEGATTVGPFEDGQDGRLLDGLFVLEGGRERRDLVVGRKAVDAGVEEVEGLPRLVELALEDEVARRLGHEPDAGEEERRGDELEADAELPGEVVRACVELVDGDGRDDDADDLDRLVDVDHGAPKRCRSELGVVEGDDVGGDAARGSGAGRESVGVRREGRDR